MELYNTFTSKSLAASCNHAKKLYAVYIKFAAYKVLFIEYFITLLRRLYVVFIFKVVYSVIWFGRSVQLVCCYTFSWKYCKFLLGFSSLSNITN